MHLSVKRLFFVAAATAAIAAVVTACSGEATGTPTPFSLGGDSRVLGFTPTPTPRLPTSGPTPKLGNGDTTPTAGGGDEGTRIFLALPCKSCHTIDSLKSQGATGSVGPNLTHIGTVAETRVAGLSADAYIRQSIAEPGAFIVSGFPNAMPPKLVEPGADLDKLVAFLLAQK